MAHIANTNAAAAAASTVSTDAATTTKATTASTTKPSNNPILVAASATIIGVWAFSQVVLIPYVVHLLLLVTAILYVACHRSLILREEPLQEGQEGYDPDAQQQQSQQPKETLRKEDAYQFPLIGSFSLFSLYIAFKFFGPDLVNLLIGGYFGLVGCAALTATLQPVLATALLSLHAKTFHNHNKPSAFGWKLTIWHPFPTSLLECPLHSQVEFSMTDLISFVLAVIVVACYYFQGKHWALNNVLGICFCIQGIERFSLGTYKIGAILLIGLFFYDIFWVFGTDVMVTVAKNVDGPIKLLFPRSLIPKDDVTGKLDLSLLGLGDIVIPGFFLSLMLRLDASLAKVSTYNVNIHETFPKPYFHTTLVAYVLGLITTLVVMIQFHAAQPALLYLVPACLGSSFGCALVRGEVHELLAYSEEEEEEEEDDDETTKPTEKNTQNGNSTEGEKVEDTSSADKKEQ